VGNVTRDSVELISNALSKHVDAYIEKIIMTGANSRQSLFVKKFALLQAQPAQTIHLQRFAMTS